MNCYRLAKNIRPTNYIIRIEPIGPHYNHFQGLCKIIYYGASNTNEIVINSFNLEIEGVELRDNDMLHHHYETQYDIGKQQVILKFDAVPSEGILTIMYTGNIYNEALGLCKTMQNNELIFYTNFEPIQARKCFPCFDEPNFKAIFSLEIAAPKNKIVLANTSTKKVIDLHGKLLHIFNNTPPMSTYLVAFYIGNIKNSVGKTFDGTIVRVFSKKSKLHREYILSNLIKSMNIMTKFFDYKYPLDKLDLVFVPVLEGLAMENWGLIIYKENEVDTDENAEWNASIFHKIESTYTIFHEVAHQWFGNIVTMDWWSDIWLNESIATWFGWYIINKIFPEWKSNEYCHITRTIPIFGLDFLDCTHPIRNNVTKPEQLVEIYDAVTYTKGASVITMLVGCIEINNFMKGIRAYVKKYRYGNTTSIDFINTIQSYTNKPIVGFMKNWLDQKNYPIIDVKMFGNDALLISQKVYSIDPAEVDKQIDKQNIWKIPLTNKILLEEKTHIYQTKDFNTKINKDGFGFYIVNYEPHIIDKILSEHFDDLDDLDISEILNDLFMTLRNGKLSYSNYIKFFGKIINNLFTRKLSGMLLEQINNQFYYFLSTTPNSKAFLELKFILEPYVITIMNKLGIVFGTDDDIDRVNGRINAFRLACHFGILAYVDYCKNTFVEFMDLHQNGIDGSHLLNFYLEDIIIRTCLTHPDTEFRDRTFNFMMKLFVSNEKIDMVIYNIIYTSDIENYHKALNVVFDDKIDNMGKIDLLINAGKNYKLNKYLWIFIKKNWNFIREIFKDIQKSIFQIAIVFQLIVDNDGSIIPDIQKFFSDKISTSKMEQVVNMIIGYINANTYFNKLFY
jgi:aminopeptidase N